MVRTPRDRLSSHARRPRELVHHLAGLEELTLLAAGSGVSRATAYRYRDADTTPLPADIVPIFSPACNGWEGVRV
jgi:hypothetical protein